MLRFRRSSILLFGAALALLLSAACTPGTPAALNTAPIPTTAPATPVPSTATTAPATATLAPATSTTAAAITVTDGLGREVTLSAPPVRIVSLAPSNTEILFALGAGDRLVGRDEFSDYPAEALAVPSIGSLYPAVNSEAVVALQPDLVLAAGITNPDDVKKLTDLGLTVYSTRVNSNLEDIYTDIQTLGTLLGREAEAQAVVTGLRDRVDAVAAKTKDVAERPVVFYEIDATDPSSPWTAGPGSFHDQLINLAGGTNAGNIANDLYVQLSLEQLVAQDPDIIVLGSATFGGQTPELVAQRAGWQDIAAVKNRAVYTFDDNLISRPSPRVVDGLEQLAKLIHPELFK